MTGTEQELGDALLKLVSLQFYDLVRANHDQAGTRESQSGTTRPPKRSERRSGAAGARGDRGWNRTKRPKPSKVFAPRIEPSVLLLACKPSRTIRS